MPRPTSKPELLHAAQAGYDKLIDRVDALADQQDRDFDFEDRDRNVRDVLAHLAEWHRMLRRWYDEGMAGGKPKIPGEGYTWQTLPALNQTIWEAAQQVPLPLTRTALAVTHADMLAIIESHSDEELFTKKRYSWTGSTSLAAYLISATSSHYDWALAKLRRAARTWPARPSGV
jgi:hypothetical protein